MAYNEEYLDTLKRPKTQASKLDTVVSEILIV
jgi:hypothetical protein